MESVPENKAMITPGNKDAARKDIKLKDAVQEPAAEGSRKDHRAGS